MPGFRHPSLVDITRIRQDLRDRYQDGFAILKELLQNADDAGATVPDGAASQLVLVLARDGLPGAGHPLLRTAGLAVLNDGAFTASDAVSITSLGMSNKAGQTGAAGKFGLGLKSIFHWAEAFFYFSSQEFTGTGQNQASACDLLNPWCSREIGNNRHENWEEAWSNSRRADLNAFTQLARKALSGARWFGLWIPLRRPEHLRDGRGEVKPIENRIPHPDLDGLLGRDWRIRLIETLPLLRRLRSVRVSELDNATLSVCGKFDVGDGTQRMRFGLNGASDAAAYRREFSGTVLAAEAALCPCRFQGTEHLKGLESLDTLKKLLYWPSQAAIGPDGGEQQVPEKAEPHGAVVFTRQPVEGRGSLRVQHAVFLPLGEPEEIPLGKPKKNPCGGPWRYCLYLHGFFFVDAGRQHLQSFDNLPEHTKPDQADTELKVVQLWNRTLLREVVAPLVLPSLDAFVKQERMAVGEIESLVEAMRNSETLKPLLPSMCRAQRFVYGLQPGGGVWQLEAWNADHGQPGRWIALPEPAFPESDLFDLFPSLKELCKQTTVSVEGMPYLAEGKPARPDDDELANLLAGVPVGSFENAAHLDYLLKLIPGDAAKREPDGVLVRALVKLAGQLIVRPLPQDKELAQHWQAFFQRLPTGAIVRLPVQSARVDRAIKQALSNHDLPVALLWEDWRDAKDDGEIAWADLLPVLRSLGALMPDNAEEILRARVVAEGARSLGALTPDNAEGVQQRSAVAVRLLEACSDQPNPWPDDVARLPLFACRRASAPVLAASRAELQQAQVEGRLFTSGESWAKDLAKAAPELKPVLVENAVAKVLGLPEVACDEAACDRLLRSAHCLANDFDDRNPLFDRLLAQGNLADDERWRALRCLLHGRIDQWENEAALFCEPPQTNAFAKLAKLALEAANGSWRLIPHSIARQLALNDHQRRSLNLRDTSTPAIEALLKEVGTERVNCTSLTSEECDTILLQFNDEDVLRGLDLHETLDKRRVCIGRHTYVDDGSFKELPEAFNQLVTRIRDRAGYGLERFRNPDGSNRLVNKLSWEAVIEIAMDQHRPTDWWETMLAAIGRLGTLRAEMRDRVREVAWLPSAAGGAVKPAELLQIAGAETELDRLPPEVLNGKVPILRLAETVRKHERFDTFTRTVLPPAKEALEVLANLLKLRPAWSTGLTGEWSAEQVADWVAALGDAPAEALPIAGVAKALHSQRECQELFPRFLESIGGQLGETAYAGVLKHLATKHQQADQEQRRKLDAVFIGYLRAIDAVGADFAKRVLQIEGVMLRSAAGHWKAPAALAWPTHGVVLDDQLCREHADALAGLQGHAPGFADAPVDAVGDQQFDQAFERTADRLREYFTRWTEFVPREIIGAFLSVLGDGHQGQIRALAGEFLGQNTVDGIREAIAGAATQPVEGGLQNALAYHRFACVLHRERTWSVPSMLGDPVDVRLGGERETVFLGSGIQAFPRAREWTERWLHLLCFDPAEASGEAERLQGLLRASAEQILASVFCQTEINLQPLWQRWGQPGQLHIRIAQNRVVEAAQAFLRQVGAHHAPAIRKVLQAWDAADRRRAEAEENNRPVSPEVQGALSEAKKQLRQLLAEDSEVQATTLAAVRGKMEQYQYDPQSVPFELWQNADDAAVELEVLGYDNQQVRDLGYVSLVGQQSVNLVHWGRLINEFQGAEGRSFRERGFDQDLEKMVVQSVSDKAAGNARRMVTGKFGLGFKSVFLVTDAPEVVSGSLDFVIRGGIYPVRLDTAQRDALVEALKRLAPEHWRRGTLIRLPLRPDGKARPDKVLALFERLAPLLVVFSRKLKRLRLRREDEPEREVRWQPEQVAEGIAVGALEGLDARVPRALVLSGTTGQDRLQLLLGLGPDGIEALPSDVPTFWVTAPTRATPDYGFAVNGPFEPDVGRVQLALNSDRNEKLANELARLLTERFAVLWQRAQEDWEAVRPRLGLASGTTLMRFGESIWEVLGRRFAEKCPRSDASQPAALARRILWGSENTGLRQFYSRCDALPTGLWGEHHRLTRLAEIRFVAAGALDREEVFRPASQWPTSGGRVQPGQVISEGSVATVLRHWQALASEPETLHLATVVEWELKQGQDLRADPEAAARLGQVVTPDFLRRLKEGKPDKREEHEHEALSELLPKVLFQAADGSWHQPAGLVVANGAGVDDDEKMRAAFAPLEARLHPGYADAALKFFLACRRRLEADVETMFEWMLQAQDDESKAAAMEYLLHGDEAMRHRLATKAREAIQAGNGGWLETVEEQSWFQQTCGDEEQDELAVHLLRTRKTEQPPPEPPPRRREDWSADDLRAWWQREQGNRREYTLEGQNWLLLCPSVHESNELNRTRILRELLGNPDSDEGRKTWYRLFGLASLMAEGRRTSELRQFWTSELEGDGKFWSSTSRRSFNEGADKVFECLCARRFTHVLANYERAYYWRRLFYDVRKMHRLVWEFGFPAMILERTRTVTSGRELIEFIRSGHLPGQAPWFGVVGQSIGSPLFYVIRELRRLGVIENRAVDAVAFFPCRPVRRAAVSIGWLDEKDVNVWAMEDLLHVSERLFEVVQTIPDLSRDFDIPLLHMGVTCQPLPPEKPNSRP